MNLETIDWALLRTQKEWLLRQSAPEADGLINLIDCIQDAATMDGVIGEELVFGPDVDEELP